LYAKSGKPTGSNQSNLYSSIVSNDGLGSCNSPISCPPNDRPEEFGGGNLLTGALKHIQSTAQPQPQQSAQPHNPSPNAGTDSMLNLQQNRSSTPPYDNNVSLQIKAGEKTQQKKKIKKNI
jgi:hypothetical protein